MNNSLIRTALAAVIAVTIALGLVGVTAISAHQQASQTSVCYLTGLTGPALQENNYYCATNAINGEVVNCCTSTYLQAIHLAQQKHIVIGTPQFLQQNVDWGGVPVTVVRFNSGYYAWHYNPSNGIATIETAENVVVYSGR